MSETIRVREGEGFDLDAVERYLRDHIEGLPEGELEVRQFPSGASNLTYLLEVGDWEGVLRRPPFGPVPPEALLLLRGRVGHRGALLRHGASQRRSCGRRVPGWGRAHARAVPGDLPRRRRHPCGAARSRPRRGQPWEPWPL